MGFGSWPPVAGSFFGGTNLPGVKPMGVPPFGGGTPLGNNVRANTRNGNSQILGEADNFMRFLGKYNDIALYTGGSMYKVAEEIIKNKRWRGKISSFAAVKFDVNPTAVSNALVRTGVVLKSVGSKVGVAGYVVTYGGAVYKAVRRTDNTSTWVDVGSTTILIIGSFSPLAPFFLIGGIAYGGYRMMKGDEMDNAIDKRFGYR